MVKWSEFLAEFIGSFLLVLVGCGSVVLTELNLVNFPGFIPLAFALVLTITIAIFGPVSGAHFNPAVTLGLYTIGNFPIRKVPAYLIAQFTGSYLAALTLGAAFIGSHSFGATHLNSGVASGVLIEAIMTAALISVIFAIVLKFRGPSLVAGAIIGTTVGLCAHFGGSSTGASMNPARSLGPALMEGLRPDIFAYLLVPTITCIIIGSLLKQRLKYIQS